MKTLSSGNCALSVPAKNSYRMVVLGASRVGKSSIVSRFLNGRFEDQYTPTIEDFHRKVYNIRGDMYQLDILDTSGNHPFPAMRRLSILTGGCRGAGWAWELEYGSVCARHFTVCKALPPSEMKLVNPRAPHREVREVLLLADRGWSQGPRTLPSDSGLIPCGCWCCLPDLWLYLGTEGLLPASCCR